MKTISKKFQNILYIIKLRTLNEKLVKILKNEYFKDNLVP